MTDRTTKVNLVVAYTSYVQGMKAAENATKDMAKNSTAAIQQQSAAFQKTSRTIGAALLAIGTVAAAGVAMAVKAFMDFSAEMAQVQALSHATTDEMSKLTDAAQTVGQRFGYSATQVAQAETELIKAGLSIKDILGGALSGALTIAADGQMDVANATQIAAEAMTQFQLKGKDVPHIADLLAAGADKALGSVGDLGQALESGGLVAHQFGLSLDDTVGTLAAFAQAGLIGERGGTDLRQMLIKLADPSAQAAAIMKQLGINLYDASGHFVGITDLAGQLQDKMKGLDEAQRNQALATIFGARAIAGANVLYTEGAKGIQGWINKVNDQGFAAEQASKKLDSLSGDLQKLQAAFQTDLIKSGSGANDLLRGLAQGATAALNAFGGLPPIVQQGVLAVGALIAAFGLAGGTALLIVPKIVEFQSALRVLGNSDIPAVSGAVAGLTKSAGAVRSGLGSVASFLTGPWGVGIAAGVTALMLFKDTMDKVGPSAADLTNAVKTASDSMGGFSEAEAKVNDQSLGFVKLKVTASQLKDELGAFAAQNNDFWGSIIGTNKAATHGDQNVYNALSTYGKTLGDLAKTDLPAAQKSFAQFSQQFNLSATDQWRLINLMGDYKSALTDQATASGLAATKQNLLKLALGQTGGPSNDAASATQSAADAFNKAAENAKTYTDNLNNLIDTLNTANKTNQDAISANAAYQDALQAAKDTIQKAKDGVDGYSTSIDQNTSAGADNVQMFSDLAAKAQDAAAKQFALDGDTNKYVGTLENQKQALINTITQLTGNSKAAQDLADKIFAIPSKKEIEIQSTAAQIARNVQALNDAINALPKSKQIDLYETTHILSQVDANREQQQHAAGGWIHGPGTPTSDSIPALLSNGEFVVRAAMASKYASVVAAINNDTYGRRGFANGGPVSYGGPSQTIIYQPAPANGVQLVELVASNTALLRDMTRAVRSGLRVDAGTVTTASRSVNASSVQAGRG